MREQEQAVKDSPSMRIGIDLQRYTRGKTGSPCPRRTPRSPPAGVHTQPIGAVVSRVCVPTSCDSCPRVTVAASTYKMLLPKLRRYRREVPSAERDRCEHEMQVAAVVLAGLPRLVPQDTQRSANEPQLALSRRGSCPGCPPRHAGREPAGDPGEAR